MAQLIFFLSGIPQLRAMTWKLIPEREVEDGRSGSSGSSGASTFHPREWSLGGAQREERVSPASAEVAVRATWP